MLVVDEGQRFASQYDSLQRGEYRRIQQPSDVRFQMRHRLARLHRVAERPPRRQRIEGVARGEDTPSDSDLLSGKSARVTGPVDEPFLAQARQRRGARLRRRDS